MTSQNVTHVKPINTGHKTLNNTNHNTRIDLSTSNAASATFYNLHSPAQIRFLFVIYNMKV